MSLNWSIEDIENSDELWSEADPDDERDAGMFSRPRMHNDIGEVTHVLDWKTHQLIFICMAVGLGGITKTNVKEFWRRLRMYEYAHGAFLRTWDEEKGYVDCPFTEEDVVRRIGLFTNCTNMTIAQWNKNLVQSIDERSRR